MQWFAAAAAYSSADLNKQFFCCLGPQTLAAFEFYESLPIKMTQPVSKHFMRLLRGLLASRGACALRASYTQSILGSLDAAPPVELRLLELFHAHHLALTFVDVLGQGAASERGRALPVSTQLQATLMCIATRFRVAGTIGLDISRGGLGHRVGPHDVADVGIKCCRRVAMVVRAG
jgi:hypothetical protein